MIKMKSLFFYQTPIGKIGIAENGNAITNLYFHDDIIPDDTVVKETELLKDEKTTDTTSNTNNQLFSKRLKTKRNTRTKIQQVTL